VSELSGIPDRRQFRASDTDREQVARILQQAMSEGRITMGELEERLNDVYAAKTLGELEPVTADLPDVTAPGATVGPAFSRAPEQRIGGTPGSATSIAVMSGATRKGNWVVPRQHNSVAFCGGVDIDLRRARFAEQHVTITAVAIMGGIDIVVPDDVIVDVTGVGFMGTFECHEKGDLADPPADAPVVTVNGLAFWGAVTVIRKPRKRPKDLEV
jgi:hypothetical protein